MAAIGGITFWSVSGQPAFPGEELERFSRPNVAGWAWRRTGRRSKSFRLKVRVDLQTGVNVHNSMLAQMSLQGALVSFTNDIGNTYSNYIVEEVLIPEDYRGRANPNRIANASGGLLGVGVAGFWLFSVYRMRYAFGV